MNCAHKSYIKAYQQQPKYKATRRSYEQTPEYKAYIKAYKQKPEYKAYMRSYIKDYARRKEEAKRFLTMTALAAKIATI